MDQHNRVFCVISHTHWDREWYMPLENFRHRLTDLMDRLLLILAEQPDYIFHLDAQTVVLEDYLAVRPGKKALLMEYIANRRIIIGPWYLQNDFYLTSGESTIRNLLEGKKLCREFGGCSKAGYAADQFGNPSQLPQIMRGFGFDNFIFGRGIARYHLDEEGNAVSEPTPTEFIWRGADGTEVLAIHMRHWYNNAQRFSADIDKATKHLSQIAALYDNEFTLTPYLLLMNGVDHLEAQPDIIEITEKVQERLPEGQYFLQYNLDDYVEAVADYIAERGISPDVVEGELRQSFDITVLQGTLSSRAYLKTANAETQALLENRLEPLYAMMEAQGMKGIYPKDQLVYTWKNLMRNHPHDSICGCSHDGVHAHMENRYAEMAEYTDVLLSRGMLTAGEHTAPFRKAEGKNYLITVANTLSTPLSGAVEVDVKILVEDDLEAFTLVDGSGKDIPFHILSKKARTTNVMSPINLPGELDIYDYKLLFDAGDVAPYSFKTFCLIPADVIRAPLLAPAALPAKIENEVLSLSVEGDRVTLTEKATGRTITDLIQLEDVADVGDSYGFYGADDEPIHRSHFGVSSRVTESNSLRQTLEINYLLPLPAEYDAASGKRSVKTADSTLSLRLSLCKGDSFVRAAYTLTNASKDHRLRIVFATDVFAKRNIADIPFDIVSRSNDDFYPKTPARISPNSSFAALAEDGKGFAVFTCGAHEYEQVENFLFFTLVRANGVINRGGTENWVVPGNQCLRTLSGRLAFCPFVGDVISAGIPSLSQAFRAPLIAIGYAADSRKFAGGRPCVQDTSIHEYFYLPDTHPAVAIPDNTPALTVSGEGILVSAFKKSEDGSGLILRVVNLAEKTSTLSFTWSGKIFKTMLDEEKHVFLGRDKLTREMGAKEILTLYLD